MQDEKVDVFDAAELELIAEAMDGFVTVTQAAIEAGVTSVTIEPPEIALVRDLARRAREQARALLALESEDPELDRAVNEAGERLSGTYGRAAVLRLSATHRMVCGMADDCEMSWMSVKRSGQVVHSYPATDEEIGAARDRLAELAEAAG